MKFQFPILILFIHTDMSDNFNVYINPDALDDLEKIMRKEHREIRKKRNLYKAELKGLINVTGLFRWLNGDMSFWMPEGIVEIQLTDEKRSGYSSYQHARIKDDADKLLYMKTDCDEVRGIDHYYVWQTTGCCEDDYSGYMLMPLKDGRYFKVSYCC
jgi:hypothetical protein